MRTLLWGVLPYVMFALLVSGTVWRWRYDQFGWTTRSSEIYESKILKIASPMFHYGILFVLAGHLLGLFVPAAWTDAIGVDEHVYQLFSLYGGTVAGAVAVAGIAMLLYRRRFRAPVFRATTANDKLMYLALVSAIVLGMWAKLAHSALDSGYNYRDTIAPWARSLFRLQPDTGLMTGVPLLFQVHAVVGMALIALVPYTRLIHMFSAPVQYLFRPYIVYRSRDDTSPDPALDRHVRRRSRV
ncbi:respiratory nitrate reductase subunit gamma [Streptomyces sp. SID11385]|uniref:respiratory nitrate reductase subunit gamma n=1 Tax=Streptomyces sp. SID11385 TaxID=2706031 RepID=UPI0013CB84CA|nr:respiratory nitrate reductase subunit gamma [Streptomyces sp. SID11385]NEA39307.1 respiratory nitrate reductase subunit gamma [Streptomyces sp. SID11385]